jgi:hypothetical protein
MASTTNSPATTSNPPATAAHAPLPADFQALEDSAPLTQAWTPSGYPIVDGKYLDLSTGELKTHTSKQQFDFFRPASLLPNSSRNKKEYNR